MQEKRQKKEQKQEAERHQKLVDALVRAAPPSRYSTPPALHASVLTMSTISIVSIAVIMHRITLPCLSGYSSTSLAASRLVHNCVHNWSHSDTMPTRGHM